jgi:hypothetical protein
MSRRTPFSSEFWLQSQLYSCLALVVSEAFSSIAAHASAL